MLFISFQCFRILKVSSTFAFLDAHNPFERLKDFQAFLEVKTLLVEDDYLKVMLPFYFNFLLILLLVIV